MIAYLAKKRKTTLLFFAMTVLLGAASFRSLPKQELPDIRIDTAMVTTIYPGAAPEKVEQNITKKIEEKINEIQGVKSINSESKDSMSIITIKTKPDADQNAVFDELRKKVQDAEADLPEDAEQPVVNDDMSRTFIQSFQITADSFEQLAQLRDTLDTWKDQLRMVPGVSQVDIQGLPEQEVEISVNAQKLQQYGIGWSQVLHAIQTKNETTPLGTIDIDSRKYRLSLPASDHVDSFANVIVTRTAEGFPVYLKDMATVRMGAKKVQYQSYFNNKPAIVVSVNAQLGTDVPGVHEAVEKKLEDLEKTLPAWAKKELIYAQIDRIDESFSDIVHEMLIAIAAVLFICMLGLNMITSMLVALAIPVSMAIGFLVLPAFGITLNEITMISMMIVLGMLVDDAVVVNDNIERRISVLGEAPSIASIEGAKEVSISIMTATFATIAAFVPLVFLPGIYGQFITPLPILVTFSMLASMVMSLTIVPIFRDWLENRSKRGNVSDDRKPAGLIGKQLEQLAAWYGDTLMPKMLNKPLRTGVVGILVGTCIYGLIPFTPVQLFPQDDRPQMVVNINMPSGSNLQETNRVALGVADWIRKQPNIQQVSAFVGGDAPKMFMNAPTVGASEDVAQLVVSFDNTKMNAADVVKPWFIQLKQLYPEATVSPHALIVGPPAGSPVAIRVYGEDLKELYTLSEQIRKIVSETNGTYDVKDSLGNEQYTLQFNVNKAVVDDKQVNEADLSRTLRLVSEGIPIGQFDNGKKLIDINLYADQTGTTKEQVLQQLTVPNAEGQLIPVSQIAEMTPSFSLQTIPRHNLARAVTISSGVMGRNATEVMNELKPKIAAFAMPEGYTWEVTGETEEQEEVFGDLASLMVVVFILILILITTQFNSVSRPALIMSTVYLAMSGSLIGLFLTQTPLGFMAVLGLTSLMGLVVRNGIVLIEFIEEGRHAGLEIKEAVIASGKARLRPILLTSSTAIGGLLPMAITGSPLFKPMAIAIIFGLLFSTLLTLIVVPSLYVAMTTRQSRMLAKRKAREKAVQQHVDSPV